jgi:hypothetical protein
MSRGTLLSTLKQVAIHKLSAACINHRAIAKKIEGLRGVVVALPINPQSFEKSNYKSVLRKRSETGEQAQTRKKIKA